MILFVVLGILILVVSFIVAFASLIYEQKENVDNEESVNYSPLQQGTVLPEGQRESPGSVSRQSAQPMQSSTAQLSNEDIATSKAVPEDRLQTAAAEAFPWEQEKKDTFRQDKDFFADTEGTKSPQKLSGVISLRGIAGEPENQ